MPLDREALLCAQMSLCFALIFVALKSFSLEISGILSLALTPPAHPALTITKSLGIVSFLSLVLCFPYFLLLVLCGSMFALMFILLVFLLFLLYCKQIEYDD